MARYPIDTAAAGHLNGEEEQIRAQLPDLPNGLFAVGGFARELQARNGAEHLATDCTEPVPARQAIPKEWRRSPDERQAGSMAGRLSSSFGSLL